MWPEYVSGQASLALHSFAVSGAVCSGKLTYSSGASSVMESQMAAFSNASLNLDPQKTLYALWIGTNDVVRKPMLQSPR